MTPWLVPLQVVAFILAVPMVIVIGTIQWLWNEWKLKEKS